MRTKLNKPKTYIYTKQNEKKAWTILGFWVNLGRACRSMSMQANGGAYEWPYTLAFI